MTQLYNFDDLQQDYINSHIDIAQYQSLNEEARLEKAYHDSMRLAEEFKHAQLGSLGGLSPFAFFDSMPTLSLVEEYIAYFHQYESAPDVLNDVLTQRKDCEEELLHIVEDEYRDIALRMNTIALLEDMESSLPVAYYVRLQCERAQEDELADRAFEALRSLPEEQVEALLEEAFDRANQAGKDTMLEVLAKPGCAETVFEYALRRYAAAKRKEIYAYYLGRMENEAALPVLQEAVQFGALDYIDYMETRVAIERLGGICEEIDYSKDPVYKQVHNHNN